MKRSLFVIAIAATVLAGCQPTRVRMTTEAPATHPLFDAKAARDLVTFHQERTHNDPQGAIGWALLSESYLQLAGEYDDDQAAIKAEEAARTSLRCRKRGNSRGAALLAKSLLAQHRFQEANMAAKKARALAPDQFPIVRLQLETELELGSYDALRKVEKQLNAVNDPATLALRARWAGVTGKNAEAIRLITRAADEVDAITPIPGPTVAWYRVQQAAALFRNGELDQADHVLDQALTLHPTGHAALGWKTRLAAGRGDWQGVVHWADRTAKIARMTDIEGLKVEALTKLGRKSEAQSELALVARANLQPGATLDLAGGGKHSHHPASNSRHTHDRLFAMALADLGRAPGYAHHAAEEDLANRRDLYALDAFAWTTYRYWQLVPASQTGEGDGLLREAERAIDSALKSGTQDPKVLFHAGMIWRHRDPLRAKALLEKALSINPHFHATQVEMARTALSQLSGLN